MSPENSEKNMSEFQLELESIPSNIEDENDYDDIGKQLSEERQYQINLLESQDEDEDEDDDSEYFDEDGNPIAVRENQVGTHKVADSTVTFECALPDYLMDLIEKRILEIEDDDWEPAEVGNVENGSLSPDVRKCDVSWIAEVDWLSTIFTHYFTIANREIWEYDLTEMEQVQVTRYDKNNFYGWHCDYGTSGDKNLTRKLSATLVISDPMEYSGGKLQFIDYMGKVVPSEKKRGTIIIFDARTPHRVTPVLKGRRISLVAWMLGPKLR